MDHEPIPQQTLVTPDELQRRIDEHEQEVQALKGELEKALTNPHRKRLQATRQSLTHKFAIGQHEGYMTVGMFEDGRPGEVFLTMAKEGSTIGGLMDTIGILTSLALQYGVPVGTLARKLEHVNFEPNGWTRDPTIRRASSVIDYIFRWLGLRFSETYRQEKAAGFGQDTPCDKSPIVPLQNEGSSFSQDSTDRPAETAEQIRP